ncbi:MAG TPA: hypothetical protein VN880_15615 [Solirubrobacteraceae bacterium]|nr:hypothetical protein [Solirubrobacteraceae bacterium]
MAPIAGAPAAEAFAPEEAVVAGCLEADAVQETGERAPATTSARDAPAITALPSVATSAARANDPKAAEPVRTALLRIDFVLRPNTLPNRLHITQEIAGSHRRLGRRCYLGAATIAKCQPIQVTIP